jgi:hypothetical protein
MRRRARRSAQRLGARVDRASAISVFASAVLTPLIVSLWARITPVAGQSEFDGMSADQRVRDRVPSQNIGARAAQLDR